MPVSVLQARTYIEKYYDSGHVSTFKKGVKQYALELFDELLGHRKIEGDLELLDPVTREELLNNAKDWSEYSYSGSALVYDEDICKRLYPPSKVKRYREGDLPPNNYENWLDVQARALAKAAGIVGCAINGPRGLRGSAKGKCRELLIC